jgi:hypothetical protein
MSDGGKRTVGEQRAMTEPQREGEWRLRAAGWRGRRRTRRRCGLRWLERSLAAAHDDEGLHADARRGRRASAARRQSAS